MIPPVSGRRLDRLVLVACALALTGVFGTAAWSQPQSSTKKPPPKTPASTSKRHGKPLVFIGKPLPRGSLRVKAPAAILVDAETGTVLWAKRAYMRRPIASTTKIMTALVAMERLRPNDLIEVPRAVTRVAPYKEGLRPGEKVRAWKLFYGLLLVSGNDTAITLAMAAGGTVSHFVALMNDKARELGLRHTRFRSTNGLVDRGNYSTVWDLAALARYAMWNRRFRAIVRTKEKLVRWSAPVHAKLYRNHNKLLWRYPGADGIKTGWTTRAGHCLVASARRYGFRLITTVLDSPDLYGDTTKLLDFGFRRRG